MPFFILGRQRLVTESIIVEAATEAEAKAKIYNGKGRLFNVVEGDVVNGTTVILPYDGLDCEEGEQVFEVVVSESHRQTVLVVAKDPDEAKEKVREGDGDFLHGTEQVDTGDSSDWTVTDKSGNIVR